MLGIFLTGFVFFAFRFVVWLWLYQFLSSCTIRPVWMSACACVCEIPFLPFHLTHLFPCFIALFFCLHTKFSSAARTKCSIKMNCAVYRVLFSVLLYFYHFCFCRKNSLLPRSLRIDSISPVAGILIFFRTNLLIVAALFLPHTLTRSRACSSSLCVYAFFGILLILLLLYGLALHCLCLFASFLFIIPWWFSSDRYLYGCPIVVFVVNSCSFSGEWMIDRPKRIMSESRLIDSLIAILHSYHQWSFQWPNSIRSELFPIFNWLLPFQLPFKSN